MAAETILYQFAKVVLAQLGSPVVEEVKLLLGLEDELDRIKSNLTSIKAVLQDAEKQQTTSESVKTWLGKLQDVMYDIDDLLDAITTEFTIHDRNQGKWVKQVRKFFSRANSLKLRWEWAHQVKHLCKKLDLIASERNCLVLSTEHVDLYSSSELAARETTSQVNKSEILGREEDKEAVINTILNCGDCDSLSIVPIVGFGGIGKTTLAQLLYNDSRIDANFDKKLWVYVSENFSMKKLLKQVISMVTGENILQLTMEHFSLEQLRLKASEALKDKKYLLILDDMWNEDSNEWRKFRELLDVGAKGSTVIVTTRDSKVSSIVQSVEGYKLAGLSHETCLQIFKQLAFIDVEKIEPTLLDLANEIVDKSRGLPLLAKTLGNLLRGETDVKEWRRVILELEQGHEDILNVLKLSYDHLSPYSKLCFRISSVYNRGKYLSPGYELLPLCMALGLLPYDDQGDALGRKCIKELISKSLFMKPERVLSDEMFAGFQMHDFVVDLAKSMAGEELAIIDNSTKNVSEKVRYIRLNADDSLGKLCDERLLTQVKKARLLIFHTPEQPIISKSSLETIISKLSFLRVLDLCGCQFEEIPRTIGYMRHLRQLTLGGNMKLKTLPNSICNLINLQTLDLWECTDLQGLPTNIGRLENLINLIVTVKQKVLPEGIGHIKGLRLLYLFNCPGLAFLPMSTRQLENLHALMIAECEELDLAHGSWLEGLKSLRILSIKGVPKFQKLSMGLPLTSLQYLNLINCEGLVEIGDQMKHLTSLKKLGVSNCPSLVGLPRTLSLLDKLEILVILKCPNLSEKCTPEKGEDWLRISNIPHIHIDGQDIVNGVVQSS